MSNTIKRSVLVNASIDRVWRAVTDHHEFGAWFRVKIGAPFAIGETSRGHMTYPGYEHLPWEAVVIAMESPARFAFTWHPYAVEAGQDYSSEPQTLVEFLLEPSGSGTRVTVIESGFDALPPDRRDAAIRSNEGGWTEQMENVRTYVDG